MCVVLITEVLINKKKIMKKAKAFLTNLFSINFICIVVTLLLCQTSYSKIISRLNTSDFKSNQLQWYFQENDTVKKMHLDLNELQKVAEFPGGLKKFYAIIKADIDDYDIDYEGFSKINVSFSIEKDGSLSSIKVNNNTMSASMKKSIVRVLKSIKTKWSPAIINDQPVRSVYDLPIVFNEKD